MLSLHRLSSVCLFDFSLLLRAVGREVGRLQTVMLNVLDSSCSAGVSRPGF